MSQMFLDALTGFTQGAQQAGAVIAQGQAQQVDAAWKNRKLANQERALDEQLLTSQQNRTQSAERFTQEKGGYELQTAQRNLMGEKVATESKVYKQYGEEIAENAAVGVLPLMRQIEIKNPAFYGILNDSGIVQSFQDNEMALQMLSKSGAGRTSADLLGGTSTKAGGGTSTKAGGGAKAEGAKAVSDMQSKFIAALSEMATANPEITKDPSFKSSFDGVIKQYSSTVQGAYQDLVKGNTAEAHAKTATGYATIFPALTSLMENIKIKKAGDDWLRKQDEAAQPKPPIGIRAPEPEVVTQDPIVKPPMPGEQGFDEYVANKPLTTESGVPEIKPDVEQRLDIEQAWGSREGNFSSEGFVENQLETEVVNALKDAHQFWRKDVAKADSYISDIVDAVHKSKELGLNPTKSEVIKWAKIKSSELIDKLKLGNRPTRSLTVDGGL